MALATTLDGTANDAIWQRVREIGFEVRNAARRFGTVLHVGMHYRWDVVSPSAPGGWHGRGFNPAWLFRVPLLQAWEEFEPWAKAGWRWMVAPNMVEGAIPPSSSWRVDYPYFNDQDRMMKTASWCVDVRIPEAQTWLVQEAIRGLQMYQADFIHLEMKSNYFWFQHARTVEAHAGGPGPWILPPMSPEEWADAQNTMLRQLHAAGAAILITDRQDPARGEKSWEWVAPDVRDMLLGDTVAAELDMPS